MLRKHQHVANAFVDAVALATGVQGKEARQALRADVGGDADWVNASTGRGNGAAVDVGGKHLQHVVLLERFHALDQQNGDGISLFASRAACAPHAHRSARGLAFKEARQHLRLQGLKGRRVAKEVGHPNQKVLKQSLHLGGRLFQKLDVAFHRIGVVHRHAPLDAAVNRAGLVQRKIVAGLRAQQRKGFAQGAGRFGNARACAVGQRARRVCHVGQQLGGHLCRGKLVVHQPGGNRALRHAVRLAGGVALRHHQAAGVLDGPHAQGAIGTHARQHNANGALALFLGQGHKEVVNRQALAVWRGRGLHVQRAVRQAHFAVGRNNVNTVCLHHHAVFHLQHRHAGAAAYQFAQQAFVVGCQVLHQHKGHAHVSLGGHAREKRLKSRQSAGGRADAYDRKMVGWFGGALGRLLG